MFSLQYVCGDFCIQKNSVLQYLSELHLARIRD